MSLKMCSIVKFLPTRLTSYPQSSLEPFPNPMTIQIREATETQDMLLMESLERQIWGYSDDAVVGKEMLIALRFEGACVALAWDDQTPIGLVLSFPTRDANTQHSHMAGVLPAYRGKSVAYELKQFQKTWCLERGITRIVWTYDPLRSVNAYFNIAKLGATCHRYLPHFYGEMGGINAGAASDRILAEWDLKRSRGKLVSHEAHIPSINSLEDPQFGFEDPQLYFELPQDYSALLEQDVEKAVLWRERSRPLFLHYLERYEITGFRREGGNAYLLERDGV